VNRAMLQVLVRLSRERALLWSVLGMPASVERTPVGDEVWMFGFETWHDAEVVAADLPLPTCVAWTH
jgi:hypothetical protein